MRITKKDTITLKCNEEEFPAQILRGYLPQRELKIQILNKTELKLDNLILKKIKLSVGITATIMPYVKSLTKVRL
ncbi:hypothetical protein LPB90_19900 [Chryseobacterium sp. LC2016-29]|uniref:hypothetical protein n=1 Tax=Chryseobacterium sp. LC2016-29 TaxID=2897331 RepID=UPI001E479526|nr:hypothetical protein [Chryseobacterium sp. LC2016-29]MCD0480712.1 hypothetical protein [Chryseobacterium sp. LC2016-29]